MDDPDAEIRIAAFARLRTLAKLFGGPIPWKALAEGFQARGQRYLFASAAEGIFRPAGMTGLLSVKTVIPKSGRDVWYHDQTSGPREQGETFSYAFSGDNPQNPRNQWLKDAMERQLPIIYFSGVAPAVYEPLFPAFVTEWNPSTLTTSIAFGLPEPKIEAVMPTAPERRYAMRLVKSRLHQASFRERVLDAYGRKCALSGLPEARLIDAAHIIPDADELLGQPDIRNGVCMSKLHHAAFDAGLIGIDPDLRVHVATRLLEASDGPLLEQGIKALHGRTIRVPEQAWAQPDRDRLEQRFREFEPAL